MKLLKNIFSFSKNSNDDIRVTIFGIKIKHKRKTKIVEDEQYILKGENNKITLVDINGQEKNYTTISKISGLDISVTGNNNTIKLHEPISHFKNLRLEIGNDNAIVEIGSNSNIQNYHFRLCFGNNQAIKIGNNTTMYGGAIVCDEDSKCFIGDNCLFAGNTQLWASDGHSIYNEDSKQLLNRVKKPIIIGNHCWLGGGSHFEEHIDS